MLETAPLSEAQLSEYCRRHGLYPEQIARWREACSRGNDHATSEHARRERRQRGERARTFDRFWRDRWQLDLAPAEALCCGGKTVAMVNDDAPFFVLYAQDTDVVRLSAPHPEDGCFSVTAVATMEAYNEIVLDSIGGGLREITLPRRTDWALAFVLEDE